MGYFFWSSVCISALFVIAVSAGLLLLTHNARKTRELCERSCVTVIPVSRCLNRLETLVRKLMCRYEENNLDYCIVLFYDSSPPESAAFSDCLCRRWENVVCCDSVAELNTIFHSVLIANSEEL